jgi:cytochrome c-type biogenesis protein CcmH
MAAFIIAAAALTLLAIGAVLFGPRLFRDRSSLSRAQANAAVLRQQLAELEADRARGLIDETELARAAEELRRRLLVDIEPASTTSADATRAPRRAILAVAVALPVAAAALYLRFGEPRLLGAPATDATAAAAGESAGDAGAVQAQLEAHVAAAPADARAWVMLARARMQRDEFGPAATAYAKALEVSPKVARDPLIWCEYADALGMAQGGRLAGKPRELIDKALALNAAHPRALEMAGSAAYEAGEFRAAARYWQQLLAQLAEGSAEHAQLAAAIARAEQRAKFTLPDS